MTSLSRQRGLSLIELMIAILLSSMLLLGVLQIFDSNRDTIRMQTAFARVQESGRFATDLLTREIRMADYWGCAPDPGSIKNHLDTSDTDYDASYLGNLGNNGVLGTDNASGETVGTKAVAEGSDILYLRGSENACGGTGRMVPSTNAASLMATQNCGVEEGQTVLLANCQSGELMTITQVQGGNGGNSDKRTLVHNTGNNSADGWINNDTKELQREYGADARLLVPYQRIYFVADSAAGDSSLFVSENGGDAQELIPGIEDMQLLYGRDTDDDETVDTWTSAAGLTEADMALAQAIKVQLVAANEANVNADDMTVTDLDDDDTTYTDGRLRKVYLSTVKVRNRGNM
ncbi:PilW family protein [Microbulbifer halophilus]|uniref:PilW family protein n=1 Tax=Microbulbifer halophilus TaxID=453963 RepID=A0ABW5E8X4_9GAMM|nr:PilW family protein [Microbulbifer halophilus]MCW8127495.1 PilW family protein [Microbulbifer halophilus]